MKNRMPQCNSELGSKKRAEKQTRSRIYRLSENLRANSLSSGYYPVCCLLSNINALYANRFSFHTVCTGYAYTQLMQSMK